MLSNKSAMGLAQLIALESKCWKYKVGAVIIRDGKIIGHGCNGTLPGMENCCDTPRDRLEHREWSATNELHAEMNAIINAKSDVEGSTLFVTMVPCQKCSVMLAGFKFKKVVYRDLHHNHGLELLEKAGVICEQI